MAAGCWAPAVHGFAVGGVLAVGCWPPDPWRGVWSTELGGFSDRPRRRGLNGDRGLRT